MRLAWLGTVTSFGYRNGEMPKGVNVAARMAQRAGLAIMLVRIGNLDVQITSKRVVRHLDNRRKDSSSEIGQLDSLERGGGG